MHTFEQLVHRFESCELTPPEWTHAAHLSVALWYVIHHPEPLEAVRSGTQNLNAHLGVEQTPDRGYHETITRFMVSAIKSFVRGNASIDDPERLRDALLQSKWSDKRTVLEYYGRDLIMSAEARYGWVEPDLAQLPELS
ncbi:MAG: hypothetical protein KC561_05530 [Myxococcales bacterium]|nr:hypothetical protein [Myxococcales bacterium]